MITNVTQLIVKYAFMKFKTINELAHAAREEGLLKKTEPLKKFAEILEGWLQRYPDGIMSNGMRYQCEIYFSHHGRLKAKHPGAKFSIGLIRCVRCVKDKP